MKKSLIKGFVLGTIFVISIILFSNMMNQELTKNSVDMEMPTMPVMYMEVSDVIVNPMYPRADEMQAKYLRDSVTPLATTRDLTAVVSVYGQEVKNLTYEVLSADGSKVIENGKMGNVKEDGDYLKSSIRLQTPLLMNQEYTLKFTLDYGAKKPVYYYTRLVQRAGLNASQYLSFVMDFYEKCMNKDTASELSTYLEPSTDVISTNYNEINVHSNFDQVTWGSLQPTIHRKGIPVIKEINETTCSIAMNYDISADVGTEEEEVSYVEYYNVEEFYRMRYNQSRVMLVDFGRSAQQIFDGNLPVLTSQGINLGVVDKDIQYSSNQNADIIAFVQAGELWSYNRSANKATKIFTFRDSSSVDQRLSVTDHEIEVVRVEESGDVDFVLYGYMNRGKHEGQMGISVYHYSAERNQAEERVFLPITLGFDFLKDDASILSYVNKKDILYVYLENALYAIDLNEKSYEVVLADINPDCFVVSESQGSVAWMDEMKEYESSGITLMNLEDGKVRVIEAKAGQRVKALGFINEDLIYGVAREEDIVTDQGGNTICGMSLVRIENHSGEVITEYQQDGVWISDAVLKEGLVELKRVKWEGNAYVPIDSENIMNNLQTSEETVSIHLSVSERKGTQLALDFSKDTQNKEMLVVLSRFEEEKIDSDMTIDVVVSGNELYYVYAGGALHSIHTKVAEAITTAEESMGIVLNSRQQYIWERGNQKDREELNVMDIPAEILAAPLDEAALKKDMGEDYTVLNLSGCSLSSILYFVNMQRGVIARKPTGESVVIVGYDPYNTYLYDPATQQTAPFGIQDSTNLFQEGGNVFYGYIENTSY